MHPRGFAHKLAEECRARNRAPHSSRRVFIIGDVAFDQIVIMLPQRQLPDQFPCSPGRLADLFDHPVVRSQHSGHFFPKRHNARAGQRGDVNDRLRFIFQRIGQGVGQNQPSFGIRVQDFNRPA